MNQEITEIQLGVKVVAVDITDEGETCHKCVFYKNLFYPCSPARCIPEEREDGRNVYFKRLE